MTETMKMTLMVIGGAAMLSYMIPKTIARESYRQQISCESMRANGYPLKPCNYWHGPRP